MHTRYLDGIKSFEGFTREAKWDHAQFSNGFGTRALYEGEKISPAEAERRFAAEISKAREFVDRHTTGWDEGTKAALTSLTYNAGTRWASSGLGEAVRNFDIDAVRTHFLAYTKASGQELPGLVKRRLMEVTWIGEQQNGTQSSPSISTSPPVKTTDHVASAASATGSHVWMQQGTSRFHHRKPTSKLFLLHHWHGCSWSSASLILPLQILFRSQWLDITSALFLTWCKCFRPKSSFDLEGVNVASIETAVTPTE